MIRTTSTHLVLYWIGLICLTSFVHAQDSSPKVPANPITTRAGLAIIDPITGQAISGEKAKRNMQTRGLKAELETFTARLREKAKANFDTTGLKEQAMANGAVKVDLQGRFRSPLMAVSPINSSVIVEHHLDLSQGSH